MTGPLSDHSGSVWTLYKRAAEWDDVIEGPDADGVTVVPLDDSFDSLVSTVRLILERHYPADVFTGQGGDPGNVFVGYVRSALEALDAKRAAFDETQGG